MQDWLLLIFSSHVNRNTQNSSYESTKYAQPVIESDQPVKSDQPTIESAKSAQPAASYIKYLRIFKQN